MRFSLVALLLILAASASAQPSTEVAGGRGTLLVSAADAPRYFGGHGHFAPDGYFQPSAADYRAALASLDGAVAGLGHARVTDASGYYRHLLGVTRQGRRQVFVAGYCDAPAEVAWTEPRAVADGGDCYFEGFFDLARGAYVDLRFHGEA